MDNNNNNNIHICIAPYGRNFRGAGSTEHLPSNLPYGEYDSLPPAYYTKVTLQAVW